MIYAKVFYHFKYDECILCFNKSNTICALIYGKFLKSNV